MKYITLVRDFESTAELKRFVEANKADGYTVNIWTNGESRVYEISC